METKTLLDRIGSWVWWRTWLLIFIGCSIMGAGFVLFINPYNFVPGGVYGMGIVLHNIFPSIQVGTFGYMFDVPLMFTAMLVFGGQFGTRTVLAALYTPGFMNILTRLVYPDAAAVESLDPALLLNGHLDLSNDLLLTCIMGAVLVGVGQGLVVRQQATTGGTDIVGMLLQKFTGIKFSTGIFLADGFVVVSGLVVIGFGLGTGQAAPNGWMLTLYSLLTIYVSSRVVAYMLDGASYDKLLFIISDHHDQLKKFILDDLNRSATYIKSKGMYTDAAREMIFLVVSRKEVRQVQHKIKEIDPRAFVVVTDADETFGEGFKQFPDKNEIQAEYRNAPSKRPEAPRSTTGYPAIQLQNGKTGERREKQITKFSTIHFES
ncbi:MAG: YitT family protein [Alistipes sp.]|nr:YitT family protein [Alistipes sp.]